MAIVTFYTNCKQETGNTVSALALATYLGIVKNKKILFISTSLNDNSIKQAFWPEQDKKKSGLFGPNTNIASENGIEGLDRIIRSNKISPDIVTDYTKVALKSRLELLMGYNGSEDQYKEIQNLYPQVISLATKCYDMVIVDIDKQLEMKTKMEITNLSDVVVAMTTQKMENIDKLIKLMAEGVILKKHKTIITLGKYDDKVKYNAKNISRNVLRQKEIINTVPYNSVLFEAVQEGKIIDIFLKFLSLKTKDENYIFLEEIKRLSEDIEKKQREVQMTRKEL